ncbi:MAG: hypothetical protein MH252_15430 [Thermosynechococcaceae cyanobacterium MS004]|nr:hypothetical protein [Thermosynechococcaceae cyanobacterium MS004]
MAVAMASGYGMEALGRILVVRLVGYMVIIGPGWMCEGSVGDLGIV